LTTSRSDKVIITCAVTGGIHTPTMSDALPFTPRDIAAQSIAAAEAGASILHLHARDPKDGRPTPDPAVFMQFLPRIKQSTDAVINVTTGGGLNMTVEQRLAAPLVAKPEMCSLNMGSMNFAIFGLADRLPHPAHALAKQQARTTFVAWRRQREGEAHVGQEFPARPSRRSSRRTDWWSGSNPSA
jgi:uncharacterized protein (DUF849 family)